MSLGPTRSGIFNVKVDPRPGLLRRVISPPIAVASRLEIASPNPVPPYLRVVDASAWVNGLNIVAC